MYATESLEVRKGCLNQQRRAAVGHSTQLRVFVDPDLLQYDEVWAAAGTWNDNFGANPNDIVRVAGGVITDLKRA
jgi:prolyl-tRNA editing enzyme YbaK/EbsC (Cys-tRNA(Pro) deacylase)